MRNLFEDLRGAVRVWRRAPGLAAAAVATLALGIGANIAIFTVTDAVLFRPLTIDEPERVVKIVLTRRDRGGHYGVAYHNFMRWRDRNESFDSMAIVGGQTFLLAGGDTVDGVERVESSAVSPSYFDVIGAEPAIGRSFERATPSADRRSVILSHGFWRARFGADPGLVGESLLLDDETYQVVGVMPEGDESSWLGWGDLFTLLDVDEAAALETPNHGGYSVFGRLLPGMSLEQARADLERMAITLEEEFPAWNRGWTTEAHPVRWWIVGEAGSSLLLLLAVVALVLLIACGNVANLLLAQSESRRGELAVRQALGAGRLRLVRQLQTESGLLALVGGVVGVAIAALGLRWLLSVAPSSLPRLDRLEIDSRMLAAALAITILAALLSGLVPALRLSRRGDRLLSSHHGATDSRSGHRLRGLLIAAEIALAITVTLGAALLGRSLLEVERVDPGFEPERLLTARFELADGAYPEKEGRLAFFRELESRLESLPGVERAALSAFRLPLLSGQGVYALFIEGHARSDTPEILVGAQAVSPSYFETMGIDLIAGELFADSDSWESSHSVIANRAFVRRFFPDADDSAAGKGALGRWVEWASGDRGTIVGVVEDVRQGRLEHDASPEIYLPWGLAPPRQAAVLRTTVDPLSLVETLRRTLQTAAPGAPVWEVYTGEQLVGQSFSRRRFVTELTLLFGLLALTLGLVGVYSVVSYATSRRKREIAIRMAFGATAPQVRRWVLGLGLRPVLLGVGFGLVLALTGARALSGELYGVAWNDPQTLLLTAALVLLTALAGCVIPARRATRVTPLSALREE